ncbi:flagellar hook-length control protein FliK [Sphingobium sp. EM0848]|uniref:flagellar hook-length control protein FliK n=1 Tax=Sphingobium sp. EM0848 TaxID=2743473 RepID=UPI00159C32EF|nr:flagellar hook-length control protein FliK [Sphingobium sp. EM0848]
MSDVNMLTSLKALLFSSAATKMPTEGTAVLAMPGEGATDFASLLNGTMEGAPGTPAVAATPALAITPDLTETVEEGAMPTEVASPLPHGLATALNAIQTHRAPSLPLPPGIAKKVDEATQLVPTETPPAEAELTEPVAAQPAPQGDDVQGTPVVETDAASPEPPELKPLELPKAPHLAEKTEVPQSAPAVVPAPIAQKDEEPEAKPDSDSKSEDDAAQPSSDSVPAAPVPTPMPIVVMAPQAAPLQQAVAPAPIQDVPVQDVTPMPSRHAAAFPVVMPQAGPEDQEEVNAPAVEQDAPIVPAPAAVAPQPATPLRAERIIAPDNAPVMAAAASVPVSAPVATAVQSSLGNEEVPSADKPVLPDQPLATAPDVKAQPMKAEALTLLQLVRDQLNARSPGTPARVGEQVSATVRTKAEHAAPVSDAASAPLQPVANDAAPQPAPAQPAILTAAPSIVANQPVVDMSASLDAQVVDMGVSGQWIDGLARDIAGLSANGAQGRFQIHANQLGPVQVDIRQGSDGAAVSLTVASEAAETALRQDSDRLRLDASLSAVRISEVKIERAPHVAEAARADGASQQGSQQQSSQTANGWTNSQNMAQSQGQAQGQAQGQGRWQARENSAFAPKNSGDAAVLNHDDARRAGNDAISARYA